MQSTRSNSAQYRTCNSQYGQGWLLHQGQQQIKVNEAPVPTYAEIVRSMQDFKRAEKLIKNKLVAQQISLESQKKETEDQKQRRKIDNKVPPKPFPVKEDQYKKPPLGLNVGLPIYETSNMQYGDAKFTSGFLGNTYKFDGLNTSVAFSKTHKALDEY